MRKVSRAEMEQFIAKNTVLFGSVKRPGIMLTPENDIVKFIYPRKKVSSTTITSQAERFERNSARLVEKGIAGPVVTDTCYIPEVPAYYVVYGKLDGEEIRDLCGEGELDHLSRLAEFIAVLHDRGVYFRALHLGNVLNLEDGQLGLIDIADLKTSMGSLSAFARGRNIAHMLNVEEDKIHFQQFGVAKFLAAYLDHADLTRWQRFWLLWRMKRRLNAEMRPALDKI